MAGGGLPTARLNRYKGRYAEGEGRYGPTPARNRAVLGYVKVARQHGIEPLELALRFGTPASACLRWHVVCMARLFCPMSLDSSHQELDLVSRRVTNPALCGSEACWPQLALRCSERGGSLFWLMVPLLMQVCAGSPLDHFSSHRRKQLGPASGAAGRFPERTAF